MTNLWLISNSKSHTTDATILSEARQAIAAQGALIEREIDLATSDLPESLDTAPDIIASLGGDGTANAIIAAYGELPQTRLLILPGGTMNLLSAKLHGEAGILEVIARAFTPHDKPDNNYLRLPHIEGPDVRSLVGIIAGPTAHWGTVREDIREADTSALIEDISDALKATFEGPRVRVRGQKEDYAAIFIEPRDDGLHAHSIVADTIADLAQHGWAWLTRDFLGGPTDAVMRSSHVALESDEPEITMLVDGERMSAVSPLELRLGQCPARFLATLHG